MGKLKMKKMTVMLIGLLLFMGTSYAQNNNQQRNIEIAKKIVHDASPNSCYDDNNRPGHLKPTSKVVTTTSSNSNGQQTNSGSHSSTTSSSVNIGLTNGGFGGNASNTHNSGSSSKNQSTTTTTTETISYRCVADPNK